MKIKRQHILILTFLTLIFSQSCENDTNKKENIDLKKVEKTENNYKAKVLLKPVSKESKASGNIVFKEEINGQIKMMALVSNLKEGIYEMYIIDNNDCTNPSQNEEKHWNPTNQKHGKWGDKQGYHKGDIGVFKADILGNGMFSFSTDEWCLGCDDVTKNIIGKRLIVTKRDTSITNSNIVVCCGLVE